jgi:thiamine monophosphate synthase
MNTNEKNSYSKSARDLVPIIFFVQIICTIYNIKFFLNEIATVAKKFFSHSLHISAFEMPLKMFLCQT